MTLDTTVSRLEDMYFSAVDNDDLEAAKAVMEQLHLAMAYANAKNQLTWAVAQANQADKEAVDGKGYQGVGSTRS